MNRALFWTEKRWERDLLESSDSLLLEDILIKDEKTKPSKKIIRRTPEIVVKEIESFLISELTPGYRWNLNDIKEFNKSLNKWMERNNFRTSDRIEELLGETKKHLLAIFPFKKINKPHFRKNKTDWPEERIEKELDSFMQFYLTPDEEWNIHDMRKNGYRPLGERLTMLGRANEEGIIETLKENGKELLEIYPLSSNLNIEKIKEHLQDFILNNLEPGESWNLQSLIETNESIRKWIIWKKLSTEKGIRKILGKEADKLLQNNPFKEKENRWIIEATGENHKKWDAKLAEKAMVNFVRTIPPIKKKWSPKMIREWNEGLYLWLINTHRYNNKPDWFTITMKYIPEKYQTKITLKGMQLIENDSQYNYRPGNMFEESEQNFGDGVADTNNSLEDCVIAQNFQSKLHNILSTLSEKYQTIIHNFLDGIEIDSKILKPIFDTIRSILLTEDEMNLFELQPN